MYSLTLLLMSTGPDCYNKIDLPCRDSDEKEDEDMSWLRLLEMVVVGTVLVVMEGESSLAAGSAGLKAEPSNVGLKADGAS